MTDSVGDPIVFVVDDDAPVRTAIGRLLESVGLQCETFPDAAAFLRRAADHPFGCVILDLRLPGPSGLDLQRELLAGGHDFPIIFISAYADVAVTVRAMEAGAIEFLTKPFEDQVLLDAVHYALDAARRRRQDREEVTALRSRFDTLTSREREVMGFVAAGMLNKQIASALGTSEKTVKVHRAQVMHKMGADSLAALVRMADRLRLPGHH